MGEGFIDPSYYRLTQLIWNDFDKFRTGPRTTPTVSAPTVFAGGGGQRRPCTAGAFGARADGGSFFCAIIKKFVEKKNGGREQGG